MGKHIETGVIPAKYNPQQYQYLLENFDQALEEIIDSIGVLDHNDTENIQGGTTNEYYHLTSADYALLTDANAQLEELHTDGSPTFEDVTLDGNINLEATTYANQNGVIYKDGVRFLHAFSYGDNGTVTPIGENIFLGEYAGNFSTGSTAPGTFYSSRNIGIGTYALTNISTGYYNTVVGTRAGEEIISSSYTTLFGYLTGNNLTTAHYNTYLGALAGYHATTGNYNTGIGMSALYNLTTGEGNTALGREAGRYIQDGSTSATTNDNSVYIGYGIKPLADGDTNEIIVGYNTTGHGSNTVTIGDDNITDTYLKGDVHTDGILTTFTSNGTDNYIDTGIKPVESISTNSILYRNILENPTFETTSDWTPAFGVESVSSNVYKVTGDGSYHAITAYQITNEVTVPSANYFVSFRAKVTGSNIDYMRIALDGSTGGTNVNNVFSQTVTSGTWQTYYARVTASADFSGYTKLFITAFFDDSASANGATLEIDGNTPPLLVNLSDIGETETDEEILYARYPAIDPADWYWEVYGKFNSLDKGSGIYASSSSRFYFDINGGEWRFGYKSQAPRSGIVADTEYHLFKIFGSGMLYIDGDLISDNSSASGTLPATNIWLFNINNLLSYSNFTCQYSKIVSSGTTLQHIVFRGNKAIDLVSNTEYTIEGTVSDPTESDVLLDVGTGLIHAGSDGTDHANVVLNDTHRSSDGTDHSYIDQSVTTTASPVHTNLTLDDGRPWVSTASKTYYVDESSGSDSNGGESSGDAFASWSKVYSLLPHNLAHSYTIKIIGNLTGYIIVRGLNAIGSANLTIEGNTTTASNQAVSSGALLSGISGGSATAIHILKYLEFNGTVKINSCVGLQIMNCDIDTSGGEGINTYYCMVGIRLCNFGTDLNSICIEATQCSQIWSHGNSGNGTTYGLKADNGSIICKEGTQPTGTTSNEQTAGGSSIQ